MVANPTIVPGAVTGYQGNGGDIFIMCLYENQASQGYTQGMAKFLGGRYEPGANLCYPDEANAHIYCIKPTYYGLKGLAQVLVQGPFNYGCIQSFGCASGDNCAGNTCGAFGSRISFETGIPIVALQTSYTPAPTGLSITPGNGELTIRWNPVPDPTGLSEVFAYTVSILSGGNPVISGAMEAGTNQVTIGGLTNGTAYNVEVRALSHNDIASNAATGTGTPVGNPNATIFNYCWGAGITSPCPVPPVNPPVMPGQSLTIISDIANTGPAGRVRGVIKAGATVIADRETTLGAYPSGGLFSVSGTYTMPNSAVTVTFEAYGWDGSKWVLTQTLSQQLVPQQVNCTDLTLDPFTATVTEGGKVTFTAAVTPASTAFDIQFKDRTGTVLGTCRTSGGTCQYFWDSTGRPPGTYYVTAYAPQGGCTSLESSIVVSPVIRQWNLNIYVKDQNTGSPINGATVTVGTQTKSTDASGYVQFRVDEGVGISISVSKTGYNTFTTVESVFSDKILNYTLAPAGAATGSVEFVSVPSGAEIFLDDTDQGVKTPYTITNVPAGKHTFALTLIGYNDTTGEVDVVGGSTAQVYATLSPVTPTKGSLSFYSTPLGAEIFIDGTDQNAVTPKTITGLSPGNHTLKLTLTGYEDWTGTVDIIAGETAYINPSLTPLSTTGSLEINSAPQGARVFIDNQDQARATPATITGLQAGAHTYKLTLAGYADAGSTFNIESGKTTVVTVQLKKLIAPETSPLVMVLPLIVLGIAGVVYLKRDKNEVKSWQY